MVMSPTMYCDASDSWMLPNKWHRIAIAAAGMYIEILLASAAIFLWTSSSPGLFRNLCLNVFFISTVTTVIFNANPLIRFDGYYILADWLEIPNLREKASKLLQRWFAWSMGKQLPPDPALPRRRQGWFVIFAVASAIYRWFVVSGIFMTLYASFKPYRLQSIGVTWAVLSMGMLIGMTVVTAWRTIKTPTQQPVKHRRRWITIGSAICLLLLILYLPVPFVVSAPFIVHRVGSMSMFAPGQGVVSRIHAVPGTQAVRLTMDDAPGKVIRSKVTQFSREAEVFAPPGLSLNDPLNWLYCHGRWIADAPWECQDDIQRLQTLATDSALPAHQNIIAKVERLLLLCAAIILLVPAGCRSVNPRAPKEFSGQVDPTATHATSKTEQTETVGSSSADAVDAKPQADTEIQNVSLSQTADESVETAEILDETQDAAITTAVDTVILDTSTVTLSISDAVREALLNTQVFRSAGTYRATSNPLLQNPQGVSTIYDTRIARTGVLFGQRSVSAARSEFDPVLGVNSNWNRDQQVQNNRFLSGGLLPGSTLESDTAAFTMRADQRLLSGGSVAVVQDWNYDQNNVTGRLFQSAYIGQLRAEVRQPLLAGAGRQYTKVAGPVSDSLVGVTGVQQGMLIAAINEKMSELDAHQALDAMIREVEFQYWQYRAAWEQEQNMQQHLDDVRTAAEMIRDRAKVGGPGGGQSWVARFDDIVLTTEIEQEDARANLLNHESNLKRLVGWQLTKDSLITPVSRPSEAPLVSDEQSCFFEATMYRPELQRSKAQIQSLTLQRDAARGLRKPRLDFVGNYHLNGFGDHLVASSSFDGKTLAGFNDATAALLRGNQAGWQLGFQFQYPVGSRLAKTQQANLEFQIARANAILKEQKTEIMHEIAGSIREIERSQFSVRNHRRRVDAARNRVASMMEEYKVKGTADLLAEVMSAQQLLRQAERSEAQSLAEYMTAQTDLIWRTGKLSETHEIRLADTAKRKQRL